MARTTPNDAVNRLAPKLDALVDTLRGHIETEASPWWARGWLGACLQVGPVVVVMFVFLGIFTGAIPSPLLKIASVTKDVAGMREALSKHVQTQEEAVKLWRSICRNTAKTDVAREMCDH